jgi:hypothetical protein
MKKLLMGVFVASCFSVNLAQAWDHGWREDGWREDGWRGEGFGVLPAIIGGAALGYAISQPRPVYVQPAPPVVVAAPPVAGVLPARPVYRKVLVYNAQCNCNVVVRRQVGWR